VVFNGCKDDVGKLSIPRDNGMMKIFSVLRYAAFALLAIVLVVAAGIAASWAPDIPVESLKARWAPAPSQFIAVDGMQVHLRDEGPRGDPSPIVLLHGTSASLHTWEGWAQALRGQRRVIRFDLPGYGLTGPHPRGAYGVEQDYPQFVLAVLDQLKVQRCVLAGNSLGGQIAWQTALFAPQRVDKLILVDAGGFPLESTSVPLGFRIARIPALAPLMRNVLPRSVVESSLRNVYGQPERVSSELIDQYYDLARREGNRAALSARMQRGYLSDASRLAEIKIPTLILWGGQDRLIPPSHGERFERAIAGSKRVVFAQLGHVPHEEDAAQTVAAVQQFLQYMRVS
jgi:pimeloyl-ACP methyl ester carboxylesterase